MNKRKSVLILLGAAVVAVAAWLLFFHKPAQTTPEVSQELKANPDLAEMNILLQADPNNDSLYYQRAKVYYNLEAYDEALKDLNHAISIDSMRPAYYHLLADVFLDYGRPNDSRRAIEVLKLAAKRFPGRIPTLLKLSEFQLIVKQHSDALGTLNQVLQIDPQNAEAFFMAGRVALDKGDTTAAVASFQKSVKINADNADAWIFLGRIFSNKDNPVAVQYFDNALRVDTNNVDARQDLGMFYKRRGEFDKAFKEYRDIIIRNPDYSDAYFDMGMIYLELDSLDKAYNNFDIAIKTDPIFVKAYYWRGVTSEKQGNLPSALVDYKQASGMSPDYQEAKEAKERLEKNGVK